MSGFLARLARLTLGRLQYCTPSDLGDMAGILASITRKQVALTELFEATIQARAEVDIDPRDFTWPIQVLSGRTSMWIVSLTPDSEGESLSVHVRGDGSEHVLRLLRAALENQYESFNGTDFLFSPVAHELRCKVNGADQTVLYAYNRMIDSLRENDMGAASIEEAAPTDVSDDEQTPPPETSN